MTVGEFALALAARTRPDLAASWDAVGHQIGDPAAPVRSIAVVHELTEAVVRQLEESPVDLVVAYHPLIFAPIRRLVPDRSPGGRAVRLLRAGVSVVVTHSDFDAMPGGMSDAMADALELTDVSGFAPVGQDRPEAEVTYGARIGTFDGSWDELVVAAACVFQAEAVRVAKADERRPARVAVSPGAGESRIAAAVAAGADVLVSGDISHHRLVEATDQGLAVIDVGHAASERPGMLCLHALVAELAGDNIHVATV